MSPENEATVSVADELKQKLTEEMVKSRLEAALNSPDSRAVVVRHINESLMGFEERDITTLLVGAVLGYLAALVLIRMVSPFK